MAVLMNWDQNPNLGGVNGWARRTSKANSNLIGVQTVTAAATTDIGVTVPSSIGNGQLATDNPWVLAIFGYQSGATVFVAEGATAAPNATGAFAATNGEINPAAFLVRGGDVLHFYPLAGAVISVAFYSVT